MRRREFATGLGVLAMLGAQRARAVVRDPLPPQGVELRYRVFFGNAEIGSQRVWIRAHDVEGHVVIEHETSMEVRILFSVAYALEHRSTEIWEGFTLKSVRSETVENKDRTIVVGHASPEGFRIKSQESEWVAPPTLVTSDSFWIAAALEASRVVNARTGDMASPDVTKVGDGRWRIKANFDHGPVEATLHFDGDFLAEAEVDSDGHMVKMVRVSA